MNLQCSSYCTGETYNLQAISEFCTNKEIVHKIYGRDVLHIDSDFTEYGKGGDIFIYSYGCIVFWGLDNANEDNILKLFAEFLQGVLENKIVDRCEYIVNSQNEDSFIDAERDRIILDDRDPGIKLSFSYGLSQSVKLAVFEESVEKTIEENREIPNTLMATGKIPLSRRELAKKIGFLFAERNFVNLNSNILDTPDFFWKRPRYEPYYEMSLKFMDIKQRIEVLNDRLNVIHELYDIISTELQHLHSSRLELIIIFLILTEVVLVVLRDILQFF